MAVCHQSKSKGDREIYSEGVNHIHLEEDTNEILEFTKLHGITFECACSILDTFFYVISEKETILQVQILHSFTFDSSQKTIIIAELNNEKFFLLREASYTIPDYFSSLPSDKKIKLEAIILNLK